MLSKWKQMGKQYVVESACCPNWYCESLDSVCFQTWQFDFLKNLQGFRLSIPGACRNRNILRSDQFSLLIACRIHNLLVASYYFHNKFLHDSSREDDHVEFLISAELISVDCGMISNCHLLSLMLLFIAQTSFLRFIVFYSSVILCQWSLHDGESIGEALNAKHVSGHIKLRQMCLCQKWQRKKLEIKQQWTSNELKAWICMTNRRIDPLYNSILRDRAFEQVSGICEANQRPDPYKKGGIRGIIETKPPNNKKALTRKTSPAKWQTSSNFKHGKLNLAFQKQQYWNPLKQESPRNHHP